MFSGGYSLRTAKLRVVRVCVYNGMNGNFTIYLEINLQNKTGKQELRLVKQDSY